MSARWSLIAGSASISSSDAARNVASYAQGLATLPAPFRVVEGDEVRAAVAELGARLTAAST